MVSELFLRIEMGLMHADYYETVKDYLHPGIHDFIEHYRCGNLIELPPFHGCNRVNKNETKKLIMYEMGEQCAVPTWKRYWRKPKPKYRRKIGFLYWTRHMTQTRFRYLFKNKGNFVYNFKLKKYEHMSETPMHYEFRDIQSIKKDLWKHALK